MPNKLDGLLTMTQSVLMPEVMAATGTTEMRTNVVSGTLTPSMPTGPALLAVVDGPPVALTLTGLEMSEAMAATGTKEESRSAATGTLTNSLPGINAAAASVETGSSVAMTPTGMSMLEVMAVTGTTKTLTTNAVHGIPTTSSLPETAAGVREENGGEHTDEP